MKKMLLFCLLAFSSSASFAQSLWRTIPETSIPIVAKRQIVPLKYQTMQLNPDMLQAFLANVPERFTPAASLSSALPVLNLPTPTGQMNRFRLTESPVMAPELQAKFPEIRCYTGYGIDDPTALLKCDLTPHGFHAMVMSSENGAYFIDPYSKGDQANYVVYYKKDYPRPNGETSVCGVKESELTGSGQPVQMREQGNCQFRRYRLVVPCTGEYATYFGGTVSGALGGINTAVNRLNSVYEADLALTFQLVANNDLVIFLDANTDPYTNSNGETMLNENVIVCNNTIGTANYDLGHVFNTDGNGGIGHFASVCDDALKARGETGSPEPIGDPYYLDFIAHEWGHQLSANHTFSNCNGDGSGATAFETGSGNTILSYAGVCGSNDVEPHNLPYFHAASLEQIGLFTTVGGGATCGMIINTSNNAPTVNGGADYVIPKSTPFVLTASGSDPNSNALTYNWEQMDSELSAQPPVSSNAEGPAFRSFLATSSPARTFPVLSAVISNTTPLWEVLPSVGRNLHFRVTVRDIGAAYGCTGEDDVTLTVDGTAGPFLVTSPNTNVTLATSTPQTITWDVAGTTANGVNCANVRISFSSNGGLSFSTVLLASTPNNGSAVVTLPNVVSNTCRIKIEGVGNIFFDMSDVNFATVIALPVELVEFQARLESAKTALLTWATASETNNRGFDIEMKREDDRDFRNVGFVGGKGTSTSKNNYEFRVPDLTEGTWYFRLKEMDFDGKTVYSAQRSLQIKDRFSVKLFPNPVQNDLNLVFFQENSGSVAFDLLNQLGQRFSLLTTQSFDKGYTNPHLSTASLPIGVYYYTCHGDSGTLQGKLVVQRQ